jgi:2-keto-4-pentenoate hydratase
MLMSTLTNRYAHALLKARTAGTLMSPITGETDLSIADAYDIARTILDARIAQGEIPVGRKIGFSNRKMWPLYGKSEPITGPIWSTLFDTTVEFAHDNNAIHKLTKAQQPRIEPELVFKLARTPDPDVDLEGLGECLEALKSWFPHFDNGNSSPPMPSLLLDCTER